MFFTKAALLTLVLTFVANAFPILEETGSLSFHESHINITNEENERELQRRAKVPGLDPQISQKHITVFDGKHAIDPYRSGTDLTKHKTRPVKDIMESWQEGTKKMRGPYVAVQGKKALVNDFTSTGANVVMEGKNSSLILLPVIF